jgi:hypothetical protein
MNYNRQFTLDVDELNLVETALREKQDRFVEDMMERKLNSAETFQAQEKIKRIQELLGSLHNQKIWYRPKDEPYISG